jgi:hypothetical protein
MPKTDSNCCGRHKNIVLCDAVLKTGRRKGEICDRRVKKDGHLKCGYHIHQSTNAISSGNIKSFDSDHSIKNSEFINNVEVPEKYTHLSNDGDDIIENGNCSDKLEYETPIDFFHNTTNTTQTTSDNNSLVDQSAITNLCIDNLEKIATSSNNTPDIISTSSNNTLDSISTSSNNTLDIISTSSLDTAEIISTSSRDTAEIIISTPSNSKADIMAACSNSKPDIISTCLNNTQNIITSDSSNKLDDHCYNLNHQLIYNEVCDKSSICDPKNIPSFLKAVGLTPEQIEQVNNSTTPISDVIEFHFTCFLQLFKQYDISSAFIEKFLVSFEKDLDITVRNFVNNRKNYKTVIETFTNRKALILETEQKYDLPVSELYRNRLKILSIKFFEGLDDSPFQYIKELKATKENVDNLIKKITKMIDLETLQTVSTQQIRSGIIPFYLYKHFVDDCYKLPVPLEQKLLKLSSETKKNKVLLRYTSKGLPFTLATYAIITEENNINYKASLIPKEKVCSLTPFCTSSGKPTQKKHKLKKKKNRK